MLISEKYKFIFIHIPKNAGTSITTALKPFAQHRLLRIVNYYCKVMHLPAPFFDAQPFNHHISAFEASETMGRDVFDSYFSFAVVRNPWDWLVSYYRYILKRDSHYQHKFVEKLGSFDAYIRWRCEEEIHSQKNLIYSREGEQLVDFVGKYENLEEDFKEICSRIGISTTLPRLNVSNTKPYWDYYSEETKELVREAFKRDIDVFSYDFK